MKLLAIITARKGSKGLPNKNFLKLFGKSLFEHVTDNALTLKNEGLIDDVYASTDSQYFLDLLYAKAGIMCHLRHNSLSGDKVKSVEVVKNVLDEQYSLNKSFTDIILLQPTSPLCSTDDLRSAISIYKTSKCQSLVSVVKLDSISPNGLYMRNVDGSTKPLLESHNKGMRRQDEGGLFKRNGALYICDVNCVIKSNSLISENPFLYEMPICRSVNIDTYADYYEAKKIYRNTKKLISAIEYSTTAQTSKANCTSINRKQIINVELLLKSMCYEVEICGMYHTNMEYSCIYFNGERVFHYGEDVTVKCIEIDICNYLNRFAFEFKQDAILNRICSLALFTESIIVLSSLCEEIAGITQNKIEKIMVDKEKEKTLL